MNEMSSANNDEMQQLEEMKMQYAHGNKVSSFYQEELEEMAAAEERKDSLTDSHPLRLANGGRDEDQGLSPPIMQLMQIH